MKVSELIEQRRAQWLEMEQLCQEASGWAWRRLPPEKVLRLAALYRSTCADLALAEASLLPSNTVNYLHQLVARGHNLLYPSRMFNFAAWRRELLQNLPARLITDRCVWLAMLIFWGGFFGAMALAAIRPGTAEQAVGAEMIEQMEEMYSEPVSSLSVNERGLMFGFYVKHNTGIGLRCFAYGLIFGVGGLFETLSNALTLGAIFGHMFTSDYRGNFVDFVTAHGPFELTAIVLSAAAGMKLGFSLIATGGASRLASLRRTAHETMPTVCAAMVLFFLAAIIEGFISPSPAPYAAKLTVAIVSLVMLFLYFVVLGIMGHRRRAA
ncbi:MAG: stage II sporulation protein M [Planctomycetales bacterium]|nr:stage II sporulation protein M [Planctomycetales bacterium]